MDYGCVFRPENGRKVHPRDRSKYRWECAHCKHAAAIAGLPCHADRDRRSKTRPRQRPDASIFDRASPPPRQLARRAARGLCGPRSQRVGGTEAVSTACMGRPCRRLRAIPAIAALHCTPRSMLAPPAHIARAAPPPQSPPALMPAARDGPCGVRCDAAPRPSVRCMAARRAYRASPSAVAVHALWLCGGDRDGRGGLESVRLRDSADGRVARAEPRPRRMSPRSAGCTVFARRPRGRRGGRRSEGRGVRPRDRGRGGADAASLGRCGVGCGRARPRLIRRNVAVGRWAAARPPRQSHRARNYSQQQLTARDAPRACFVVAVRSLVHAPLIRSRI